MSEQQSSSDKSLEERVEFLEQKVRELEAQLSESGRDVSSDSYLRVDEDHDVQESVSRSTSGTMWRSIDFSEEWLNKLGIGLLLLGVAFLFKYSVDQGWLIPPVRSLIGLVIGLGLLLPGLQLHSERVRLKQILLGGGVASFYITGFATFQLYNFVSPGAAWIFMVTVTLLSLFLSLQQNQAVLSVIAILGGLGTPFMLHSGEGSLINLMAFTSLVLGGGAAVYFYKGWRKLLWWMAEGAGAVLGIAYWNNIFGFDRIISIDRFALLAGILAVLLFLWVIPVIREMLVQKNPARWETPRRTEGEESDGVDLPMANSTVFVMVLLLPVLSLLYSMRLWELKKEIWGVIAMGGSLMVGYPFFPLRKINLSKLAFIHSFTALIFLTIAFFLFLKGDIFLPILIMEGLGLRIAAGSTSDEKLSLASHFIFLVAAGGLVNNYIMHSADVSVFNLNALTNLFIIGITALAVPRWLTNKSTQQFYLLAAHLAMLGWLLVEFMALEKGQAYVSLSWGMYAILLLLLGIYRNRRWLRLAGMGTIFLVVGKLFLVDFSQLEPLWRILLFIGFGSTFLLIGYFVQKKFDMNSF